MLVRAVAITSAAVLGATALLQPPLPARASTQTSPARPQAPAATDRISVIAHRGASGYAPENTLAAVDKAHELGFTWVENDVQRTKDGELVVLHDTDLKRTTNAEELYPGRAPWKVADFTAAEIARLDAGSWFGAEFTGARVPTLKQYLERVDENRQKLLLEIKAPELYPGIERDILRTLDEEHWLAASGSSRRLVVQSFSAPSLRTLHGLRGGVTTGFLGTPAVSDLGTYAEFADQINPTAATLTADYVTSVHAVHGVHGRPLHVSTWTVNDADTTRRVAGYGVDGIITNVPDTVREALESR
ncbi:MULTISPECIES: glycerophosphodiester phosphodiesterase [Streptomyces]|uniref:Glycerophosphoryl diester phosphodiesterase n=1 Tax=Streptomyces albus (strain ATCC 21838 / DSM 41398 / FERM P-419 / JCM 4703 / NBRC 107858) TaxID=1081613 RepID=A0A0B5EWY4_STRA4|nr:glycerophosphodiester phosphodiesterase family protein [Streptomyces sp. SCSIO ZS0520]AJE86309.1 glycerophosphoryl diester phosphodiesterase [Streptomyces albus]AOU80611.1 glycerophosphoryl diester phosphodiesterase [Streptomyces albus]AYN36321.1 glycerophosphodiester phosphodiesterase [Streptomyces albus]